MFSQLNAGRRARLNDELAVLKALPLKRLDDSTIFHVKVGPSSTIRIRKNVYSVHSRLIGERIEVRLFAESLEVWYAQQRIETIPRLRGSGKHHIQYRHIIEWLRRKPGAFERYRYLSDLFPSSRFRMAYDALKATSPRRAHKIYLGILYLAARKTERGVDEALGRLLEQGMPLSVEAVETLLGSEQQPPSPPMVAVDEIDLELYDTLLEAGEPREESLDDDTAQEGLL